jgi:hypothetical protein
VARYRHASQRCRSKGPGMEQHKPKALPLTAEGIFEPWELEGKSKRDCLPHRAKLLSRMSYASMLAAGASFSCFVPAIIGLVLGLAAWTMANQDLRQIRKGEMDTNGHHATLIARNNAVVASALCVIAPLVWIAVVFVFLGKNLPIPF